MAIRIRSLPDPAPAPAKAELARPDPVPDPVPARPDLAPAKRERFDRVAYQRAYMRARRARAKLTDKALNKS